MEDFNVVDLIATKRDGDLLSKEQIHFFAKGVASGNIPDCQVGAMLMAIRLKDMSAEETSYLTEAMIQSGCTLSWPAEWQGCVGDKHSTGGVGDKVSLILAPALAACEVKVPMISGRGLGHTGGTLDKLESIPGFRVKLSHEEMTQVLHKVGCCIVGQTESLAPTDKVLYAIRDITGTVASIPLIASSIISKKAAESLSALVLDVKQGRAAFATSLSTAQQLAKTLVKTAENLGVSCTALITEMDHPIGKTIGNSLEVAESIQCLHGKGPEDLEELVCLQGGYLLHMLKKVNSQQEGSEIIKQSLQNGMALKKFREMLMAQGVAQDIAEGVCDENVSPYKYLPLATQSHELKAQKSGLIKDINALHFATVCGNLGAGRQNVTDEINPGVGICFKVRVGDYVNEGDVLALIYHSGKLSNDNITHLQESVTIEGSAKKESLPIRSRLIEVVGKGESKGSIFVGQ